MNFGFGILPGWWGSKEQWRARAQGVNEDRWHSLIQENGFLGNDLFLRDFQNEEYHNFSIIVTTTVLKAKQPARSCAIVTVIEEESTVQGQLASMLCDRLLENNDGHRNEIMAWSRMAGTSIDVEDLLIFLVEFDTPTLNNLASDQFESLKDLILGVKNIFWVTSTDLDSLSYPYFGMAQFP